MEIAEERSERREGAQATPPTGRGAGHETDTDKERSEDCNWMDLP